MSPAGDRTGPEARGPMTGRGLGYCAGNDRPVYIESGFGRGLGPCGRGLARGRGFGFRRMNPVYQEPEYTKEQETKILEAEKAEIEAELNEIKKEIEALKKTKNK